MRSVGPGLPLDLVPQLAPDVLAPVARAGQFGKERADHHRADQIGGVVVRADGPRLLEMLLGVDAMLLEHRGHFAEDLGVDRRVVHHVGEAQRHVEGARGDLHRHRPLHAHPYRAVVAELADGRNPRPRPGAALGGGAR